MTDPDASRFSVLAFAVAVVTVGVGTAAGLAFVPVAGTYVGMLLGGFVAGLAVADRPLLEAGVAAVLASFGVLLAGTLVGNSILGAVLALTSISPTTLVVSVVLSFTVGAFGAHFGDDLYDGLTAPVDEGDPEPRIFESAVNPLTATESTDDASVEEATSAGHAEGHERERQPADAVTERHPDELESAERESSERERESADIEDGSPEREDESADVDLEREK